MTYIYSHVDGIEPDIEVEAYSFEEAESIMFHETHALNPYEWELSEVEE